MADSPPLYDSDRSSTVNALVGGVASVVLAFLPFSPAFGGALAGYLEGPDTSDGLRVGAYAGLVALVPFVLLLLFFGGAFLAFTPMMGSRGGMFGAFSLVALVFVLLFGALYTVGLSALGGLVGAYVHREL